MAQLKVKFGADGNKNGSAWTTSYINHGAFETVIVDSDRWYRQIYGSNESIQAFLLGVLKYRYPEIEWTRAYIIEIIQL